MNIRDLFTGKKVQSPSLQDLVERNPELRSIPEIGTTSFLPGDSGEPVLETLAPTSKYLSWNPARAKRELSAREYGCWFQNHDAKFKR